MIRSAVGFSLSPGLVCLSPFSLTEAGLASLANSEKQKMFSGTKR